MGAFGATECVAAEAPAVAVYRWLAQGRRLSAKPPVVFWRERLSGACLPGVGASLALIRRAA